MQRTKQSIKNASFSIVCQGIQQLLKVIVRIVFIRVIGQEYLGLNSVFTDILTALQLVELGVGPAIAYSLYKPLAENDIQKVKSIMSLFKKTYRIIGLIVLILGICFTPFYSFFINEIPDIPNMNFIYLIFVFDTAVSYLYSYYRTLLISDQKKYIDILIQTAVISAISILQIILIIITHNYIFYILAQVIGTILTNFIASRFALKEYPYLNDKDIKKLDVQTYGEIKKNVFAMIFHKIGSIVRDATDNLLISKYIGLAISGIYSNYSMIIRALTNIISQLFTAVLSSVGNLHVKANEKDKITVFYNINFINFWIASFCACCFGALINPFILIIADESYLLSPFVTCLITLRFYLDVMRKTPWMFCEAAGIYWKGRTKPLIEVAVNLVTSIILAKYIGIAGIFVGTIITILAVDVTIEPYLAFKYVLKDKIWKYYLRYIVYLFIFIIMFTSANLTSSLIHGNEISSFVLKAIITVVTTNILVIVITFRTNEFKYVKILAKGYTGQLIKKIKK